MPCTCRTLRKACGCWPWACSATTPPTGGTLRVLGWMMVHYKSVLKSRRAGYRLYTFPWFCISACLPLRPSTILTPACVHFSLVLHFCMPPPPPFRHSDTRMLKLQQHRCKTHGFRTFSCFGPHIWNSLPQDLRHC